MFFEVLVSLLGKHGVTIHDVNVTETGQAKIDIDFSEHDKAFEDKIANLENQIAYMKEKKNYLRTRCMEDATDAFDSGAYGKLTIVGRRVDLETENDKLKQKISDLESLMKKQDEFLEMKNIQISELKQRIAELESMETKKPINGWICVVAKEINGQEYVRLEDFMSVMNGLREENRFEDDGK